MDTPTLPENSRVNTALVPTRATSAKPTTVSRPLKPPPASTPDPALPEVRDKIWREWGAGVFKMISRAALDFRSLDPLGHSFTRPLFASLTFQLISHSTLYPFDPLPS